MGKSKTTRFKRPKFNAVGLPAEAVKEADAEDEERVDDSCPAAELLEKVRPLLFIAPLNLCCRVVSYPRMADSHAHALTTN